MPKLRIQHASWAIRLSGLLVFPAIFFLNRDILDDALATVSDARIGFVIAGALVMLAASTVRAMRWRLLAEAAGVYYAKFIDYLSIYYAGLFLGMAVPQIAASFAPVVIMREDGHSWRRSTISILCDRIVETVVIVLAAAAAAVYLSPDYPRLAAVVLLVCGAVVAGGVTVVLVWRFAPAVIARVEHGPLTRLRRYTDALESPEARELYAGMRARARQIAFLSAVVVVLQITVVVLLADSLRIDASVAFLAAAAAMVVLVVMLPISVAGLGSREGILVLLFTAAGEPKEEAVALGVLLFFVGLVARLPGLLGWLRRGSPRSATPAESQYDITVS